MNLKHIQSITTVKQIFQFRLYAIYSQACLDDHLCKTTTRLRRPMLSTPEPIPIQSLVYKTTTYLTPLATTFFCPPNEKKTV